MAEYTPSPDGVHLSTKAVRGMILHHATTRLGWTWDETNRRLDAWLATHDAEVRASVVTEEPEWEIEYGVRGDVDSPMSSREAAEHAIERMAKGPRGYRIILSLVKRRVSPWAPVEQGDETDA